MLDKTAKTSNATATIQWTHEVREIEGDRISFAELNSFYTLPPDIDADVRAKIQVGSRLTCTADRDCNIHTIELVAPPTMRTQIGAAIGSMLGRLLRHDRAHAPQSRTHTP